MSRLLKLLACLWLVIAHRAGKIALILAALALFLVVSRAFALEPGVFDIVIYGGEDYRLNLSFKDNTGAAINLTGHTIKAQARKQPTDVAAFATFSSAVTDAAAGRVAIWLSRRATAANVANAGVYDIRDTAPDSSISYPVQGKIRIMPTVTR